MHAKNAKNAFLIFFIILAAVFLSGCVSSGLSGSTVAVGETKTVTKIIDGDTVITEGGDSVRLLGIDTDEKGYPCYTEAKNRLEELVLSKKVYLEPEGEDKDQYGRYLRYIFLGGENVNLIMVNEGLAVARFDADNKKYKAEFTAAEKEAMEKGIGCKWSGTSQTKPAQETTSTPVAGTIDACNAGDYVGQEITVSGKVIDATKSKTSTVFLNFGDFYPDHCFTAVIFSSALSKFPKDPHLYYKGKTVKISGKVQLYQGKPEIILEESPQIEIVQ
jgi:micrococcal nuclease